MISVISYFLRFQMRRCVSAAAVMVASRGCIFLHILNMNFMLAYLAYFCIIIA